MKAARQREAMVAYFIRRHGDECSVIKLLADNREEVVQDGMTLIEAEILCAMKIDDLPRGAAAAGELPLEEPRPKRPRQLSLKF
jgi:hypothetical protein